MKINEVEQLVGITKKNIRFYEQQGLISPSRNQENGYRDYSENDVEALLKVKLLRKLAVPIEEIRKLQSNHLTLSGCMERHIISLSHEEKNLALIKEMCEKISDGEEGIGSLDAKAYLQKMEQLEEGGNRFMDIEKKDAKKKKYGPMAAAACMIVCMGAFAGLVLWGNMEDKMPLPLLIIILIVPAMIIIGVVIALRQRLREIERGEEYEASKY